MSSRNRVTPTGSLIAAPGTRGLLMGNRGILLSKHYELEQPNVKGKPWITCVMKDGNNIPIPESPVKYTKLFFLDELTAFAAGHRPCGGCQRARYKLFLEIWGRVNGVQNAPIDTSLHVERCGGRDGGIKPVVLRQLSSLPSGTMVALARGGTPHLLHTGKLFPWSVNGYGHPVTAAMYTEVQVLTPPSIVKVFQAGFPLPLDIETTVHPSAKAYLG